MASASASAASSSSSSSSSSRVIDTVVVHPLVLLSCTDHYNRVARDTQNRRVVGLLLGESFKGRVDVTNSFAVVAWAACARACVCVLSVVCGRGCAVAWY